MMRWIATGLVAGLTGSFVWARRGSPFRPGVDTPDALGYLVGAALTPVLIGFALSWIIGRFRTDAPGALHRRANWLAVVAAALAIAGNIAQRAV